MQITDRMMTEGVKREDRRVLEFRSPLTHGKYSSATYHTTLHGAEKPTPQKTSMERVHVHGPMMYNIPFLGSQWVLETILAEQRTILGSDETRGHFLSQGTLFSITFPSSRKQMMAPVGTSGSNISSYKIWRHCGVSTPNM